MGGNAFENLRRLDAAEYVTYEAEVLQHLGQIYQRFAPIRYYRRKPDFGDMDVVVADPALSRDDFAAFLASIGADDVFYNKSIYSFRYQDFQVDLIHVEPQHFDTAQFYFAYNDLNNLVGRVAHKLGVKFGWDGLTYQIRTESGHRAQKIVLSTEPAAIYRFLGYDYSRWEQGFDTLEDIFAFVASSPYFHPELYAFENLNNINRTRNRKRKTYTAFLDWLAEHPECTAEARHRFHADKSLYLIKLHNAFPEADLLGQLKAYAEELAAHQTRKAKFNGGLIGSWTGQSGKALGQWIAAYTRSLGGKDALALWLDAQTPEAIKVHFMAFYAETQGEIDALPVRKDS